MKKSANDLVQAPEKETFCDRPLSISGHVWCDDQADMYIGRCDHLSPKAILIQNFPKTVDVPKGTTATCCDYLYFVCWSNDSGQNGLLAEITGAVTIPTNNTDWEVFPTGLDYDSNSPRPPRDLVLAQIKIADCNKLWKKPTLGGKNVKGGSAPFNPVTGVSPNANFIWCDSGNDPSPGHPFVGFNHGEFLIFRLPVKKLYPECVQCECECCDCGDCGCGGCNEHAAAQEKELANRAQAKTAVIPGSSNIPSLCPIRPYTHTECSQALGVQQLSLCFYLHLLDGPRDQVETHDTEVVYLTVCNHYSDLEFRGLRITKLTFVPSAPASQIQIIPDSFLCFDCLSPCTCKSRELALITRDVPPGNYRLEIEYCVDEIVVNKELKGTTSFNLNVVKD
ncbi:MAG: hypothetical protein GC192_24640 [Bacteroidetes bacterium]|nr:hypothetical protein [Bacteroidota bacterium]